eukprot:s1776_g1.t1
MEEGGEEESTESDEEVEETPVIMKRPAARARKTQDQEVEEDQEKADEVEPEAPRQKKPPIHAPVVEPFPLKPAAAPKIEQTPSEAPSVPPVAEPVKSGAQSVPAVAPAESLTEPADADAGAAAPLKRARTDGVDSQWLGASVSTFGSGTTVPATELQLQAQLAAARAQINALMAQQEQQKAASLEDAEKDARYRRMDADLWEKPILNEDWSARPLPPSALWNMNKPSRMWQQLPTVSHQVPNVPPPVWAGVNAFPAKPLKTETVVVGATLPPVKAAAPVPSVPAVAPPAQAMAPPPAPMPSAQPAVPEAGLSVPAPPQPPAGGDELEALARTLGAGAASALPTPALPDDLSAMIAASPAQRLALPGQGAVQALDPTVNTSTHRSAHMRLQRCFLLCFVDPKYAKNRVRIYGHQDKRKLLQTWVAEAENRSACESRVVISKENANTFRGQRELLSVRDMILVKQWPMEKIRGIISRGGGVPDEDAPTVPALARYWCCTSQTQTEEESVRQLSQTQIAAATTSEGLGAMMQGAMGPRGGAMVNITDDQLSEITRPSAKAKAKAKAKATAKAAAVTPVEPQTADELKAALGNLKD